MKKYLLFLFLCFSFTKVFSQSGNLYLIFDKNEPVVVKNVYKYVRRPASKPIMYGCAMFTIGSDQYYFHYPFYYGDNLQLKTKEGAVAQIIDRSQVATLYPTAMTAAQLDAVMQPHIEYDYTHWIDERAGQSIGDAATVKYFDSFAKIYVIEYLPNNKAKVIEVFVSNTFE